MANVKMDGLKGYSLVLNKRYSKKILNEIPSGTQFFCSTVENDSRFWVVLLLFQPLIVLQTSLTLIFTWQAII